MATYILVPGADGRAWYWHRVVPELERRGHDVLAVDLPLDDPSAGLSECADAVVAAVGQGHEQPVLVAQSLAGFIAPLVCSQVSIRLLVLLNAMVPSPGESAGEWWANTRHAEARSAFGDFDLGRDFFHDASPEVTAVALSGEPGQPSDKLFAEPWPLQRWPDVPTRFLQGRDDRFFPLDFQRRVVQARLGIELEEMPGGHLVALSRPVELAERLDSYLLDA
jgi:pimeloyl-ACP methyl ester carboxylesterase